MCCSTTSMEVANCCLHTIVLVCVCLSTATRPPSVADSYGSQNIEDMSGRRTQALKAVLDTETGDYRGIATAPVETSGFTPRRLRQSQDLYAKRRRRKIDTVGSRDKMKTPRSYSSEEVSESLAYVDRLQEGIAQAGKECSVKDTDSQSSISNVQASIGIVPAPISDQFLVQSGNVALIATTLNNLFTEPPSSSRNRSFDILSANQHDDAFYYALVRAIVSIHDVIYAAEVILDRDQYGEDAAKGSEDGSLGRARRGRGFSAYAYRNRTTRRVHTLSPDTNTMFKNEDRDEDELQWFWSLKDRNIPDINPKVCSVDSPFNWTPGVQAGISSDVDDGVWSPTYSKCIGGVRTWLATFSLPFYGCAPQAHGKGGARGRPSGGAGGRIVFKGAVKIDIDIERFDINQCFDSGDGVFAGTHKCLPTTQCHFLPGHGFRRGGYVCNCSMGYYFPTSRTAALPHSSSPSSSSSSTFDSSSSFSAYSSNHHSGNVPFKFFFRGVDVELFYSVDVTNGSGLDGVTTTAARDASIYQCLACARGCRTCNPDGACAGSDSGGGAVSFLRLAVLCLESFSMLASVVVAIVIGRLRHTKVMKASFWILLEIIIIGALLVYSTVVIQYSMPSQLTCVLVPWFREVGFFIVYGALVVNIYRVRAEFQSRKAQRILLRDKDLLRYLAGIVCLVLVYMIMWTVSTADRMWHGGRPLVDQRPLTSSPVSAAYDGGATVAWSAVCAYTWWQLVTDVGELVFLSIGIYLCHCIRSAPSFYLDTRYISWAIYNETALSILFQILRYCLWSVADADYLYLLYFLRCQLTITVTLALVIGTKVWYTHRPPDDTTCRRRAYSAAETQDPLESTKLNMTSLGGDGDVMDSNNIEMNPDDIKAELRRLYIQIQAYKSRANARKDPSTRASKRRAMSRRQTATSSHRRFSLQAFHGKSKAAVGGAGAGVTGGSGGGGGGGAGGESIGGGVGADPDVASASRTPEESTNSCAVGVAAAGGEGETVAAVEHEVVPAASCSGGRLSPCAARARAV